MRLAKLLFLILFLAAPAGAGDDIQAVNAVWNDFVSALRRGDYRLAHGLFSPESRAVMPFESFVREYGPLSSAREMVLAKPETQSTRLEDDWAEITYGGVNAATGRAFRVGVSLVKNDAWGLVAARNETQERLEAGARGLLRMAANWRGQADARQRLEELVTINTGKNPVIRYYRFETDGAAFKALPQLSGLRAFHVDAWGMVRPGETAAAPAPLASRPAPAPKAPPVSLNGPIAEFGTGTKALPLPPPPPAASAPTVRVMANGLPEMAEPPAVNPFAGDPGELPEPAPPSARRMARVLEPEPVLLPDMIK